MRKWSWQLLIGLLTLVLAFGAGCSSGDDDDDNNDAVDDDNDAADDDAADDDATDDDNDTSADDDTGTDDDTTDDDDDDDDDNDDNDDNDDDDATPPMTTFQVVLEEGTNDVVVYVKEPLVFSKGETNKGTGGPDAYGYNWDDTEAYVWNDISATGIEVPGDDEAVTDPINLGFNFVFYGNVYTATSITTNGTVSFEGTNSFEVDCDWAATPIKQFAGIWADLVSSSIGTIHYKSEGTAPNRKFTVQYTGVALYTGNQATLTGALGIMGDSEANSLQQSCGASVGTAESAVRFTHPSGYSILTPEEANGGGDLGDDVTYTLYVINLSGSKGTYNIGYSGNTWEVNGPATLDVATGEIGSFNVTVTIPPDANYGDSDAVTVTVTKDLETLTSTLTTWAACDISYDDGSMEEQLGCSKDKGPCYMGTVFTPPGAVTIRSVQIMFASAGGTPSPSPFRLCFFDATVAGGPSGSGTCFGPYSAPNFDVWYTMAVPTPQAVDSDFAIVLDQTSGFLSLGRDTNSDVGRGWASTDDAASWGSLNSIGFPGNFMLRASFCDAEKENCGELK